LAVKILHAADLHMDSAYGSLPTEKAILRRAEQRDMLFYIADLANKEEVQLVLLSGDLFDSGASYKDTYEALLDALKTIKAEVFIAPGNHDYFCPKSPYAFLEFPENVHIFKSPIVSSVTLDKLNCRVYGIGFSASRCPSLLEGFSAENDGLINIMTVHGELNGDMYNHISPEMIENSGLDYLALGHVHEFSGIQRLGDTYFAYPGCTAGRGFDELGTKGVIIGTVDKENVNLKLVPIEGREYKTFDMDLTDKKNVNDALSEFFAEHPEEKKNIVRIVLKGLYSGNINENELMLALSDKCFHLIIKDETRLGVDIWTGMNEDTLSGLFLKSMSMKYKAAERTEEKERINMAVRFGLSALEDREEWRP